MVKVGRGISRKPEWSGVPVRLAGGGGGARKDGILPTAVKYSSRFVVSNCSDTVLANFGAMI